MSDTQNDHKPNPLTQPTIYITTNNAKNEGTIHSKRTAQWIKQIALKYASASLYTTSTMPPNLNDDVDIKFDQDIQAQKQTPIVLPNGTACRFIDFEPNSKGFMHRTISLDYGIVMEGEIVLELSDGIEVLMKRGDVAIQRATMHAWTNPSPNTWARVLFVLQDCRPIFIDGKRLKEDLGTAEDYVPKSNDDLE